MTSLYRLSSSLSLGLLALVWCSRIPGLMNADLGPVGLLIIFGIALAVTVTVWILTGRRTLHNSDSPSDSLGLMWIAVCAAPVLGSSLLVTGWMRAGGYPLWALVGDMGTNTMQALSIHEHGGVGYGLTSNAAPLTNLLMAAGYGLQPTPSLAQAITSNGVVLLLLGAVASFVSAWFTAGFVKRLNPVVAALFIFGVGWLPYTGILFFQISGAGHANVWTAYLVLWLAFIVYSCPSSLLRFGVRMSIIFGLVTVTAATWAPLMTFPVALIVSQLLSAWANRRNYRQVSSYTWIIPIVAFLQMVVYMVVFSLPDLRASGQALGWDGWTVPFTSVAIFMSFVVYFILVTGLWWLFSARTREQSALVTQGLFWVLVSSVAGFVLLIVPRMGQEVLLGYYPVKYLSIVFTLVAAVLIGQIGAVVPQGRSMASQLTAGIFAFVVFLVATLVPYNFEQKKVSLAAAVTNTVGEYSMEKTEAISRLIKIYDSNPHGANLALSEDPSETALSNFYLIRLSAEYGEPNPVVRYIYMQDQWTDDVLCDLVDEWNKPVTVYVEPEEVSGTTEQFEGCEGDADVTVKEWPDP